MVKILIVEDDLVSRLTLRKILEPLGHVDEAEDGVAGLAKFQDALHQSSPYELIFLDIMMPRKDGQATLQEMRAAEHQLEIQPEWAAKVIMTTAVDDEEHVFEAHVEGCAAYVIKPVSRKTIYEEMQKLGFQMPVNAAKPNH